MLSALSLFEYSQPFERLHNSISASLSRYCSLHPNDVSRLEIATGFDIELEDRVWINPRTKKFHLSQYCSGSKNNAEISLKQAKQEGFVPCKRCFK